MAYIHEEFEDSDLIATEYEKQMIVKVQLTLKQGCQTKWNGRETRHGCYTAERQSLLRVSYHQSDSEHVGLVQRSSKSWDAGDLHQSSGFVKQAGDVNRS